MWVNNRENLLRTALTQFALLGYEGIGVQGIAELARVTKPTLYHYFGNKRGLMDAIVKEWGDRFIDKLILASVYNGDVMGTLKKTAGAYLGFAEGEPYFYALFRSMRTLPSESEAFSISRPLVEKEYTTIRVLFEKIAGDLGNIRGRYVVYAATFIGVVNAYIDAFTSKLPYKEEDLLYRMIHQFLHGIFS